MIKNAVQSVIEREGEVYAVFIDLKAAFDRVNRKELNETMKKGRIEDKLRRVIMKIYEETENVIRVGNSEIGKFWMEDGGRQGCKISATLFNVYLSDLEKELCKVNEGGIVVGKKKIWSISYADDIVLLATDKTAIKEMIKRTEKYLDRKKMELNTKKTKSMLIKKSKKGRKKKKIKNGCGRGKKLNG